MRLDGIFNLRKELASLKKQIHRKDSPARKFLNLPYILTASFLVFALFALSLLNQGNDLKKQVLGTAATGFEYIEAGEINKGFETLLLVRGDIEQSSKSLSTILKFLPQGQDLDKVLDAAELLAGGFDILVEASREFQSLRMNWNRETNSSDLALYQGLFSSRQKVMTGEEKIERSLILLESVNANSVPQEFREGFVKTLGEISKARQALEQFLVLENLAIKLLAGEEKTYLLIFQNNNEVRPTGGFIGTYGLLELSNGKARIQKIESVYSLDGQLREQIPAPAPLQRFLTQFWGTRDANWFVDFPESARNILGFFEKTTGLLPDGIISSTPDVFEELLAVTGPVEMLEYGEILTSENFRSVVQYKTSIDYDRELNQPKKFLADFTPRFLEKLERLDQNQMLEVFAILGKAVSEKDILMFSTDSSIETDIKKLGLGGEIRETDGDFLGIFHSNVGGGKTDLAIKQNVSQEVNIDSSGKAKVNLTITRSHQGFDEKFFPKNVDYMRILVPAGSKLISSSGFDVYEQTGIGREAGYTVFSNWFTLNPGEEKTVRLIYELPEVIAKTYTLLLQKQPGAPPFEYSLKVSHPWKNIIFQHPENFAGTIASDKFYGIVGE